MSAPATRPGVGILDDISGLLQDLPNPAPPATFTTPELAASDVPLARTGCQFPSASRGHLPRRRRRRRRLACPQAEQSAVPCVQTLGPWVLPIIILAIHACGRPGYRSPPTLEPSLNPHLLLNPRSSGQSAHGPTTFVRFCGPLPWHGLLKLMDVVFRQASYSFALACACRCIF